MSCRRYVKIIRTCWQCPMMGMENKQFDPGKEKLMPDTPLIVRVAVCKYHRSGRRRQGPGRKLTKVFQLGLMLNHPDPKAPIPGWCQLELAETFEEYQFEFDEKTSGDVV